MSQLNTDNGFAALGLHPLIVESLAERNLFVPTEIQARAVAPGLAGRDVLAVAPTGTGKTLAFLLSILQQLADGSVPLRKEGQPLAVIVTPTRELAMQISQDLHPSLWNFPVRTVYVRGKSDPHPEIVNLRRRVDIVVGSPGRLDWHLGNGHFDPAYVRTYVLDEADQLLRGEFRANTDSIRRRLPSDVRMVMASATFPDKDLAAADARLRPDRIVVRQHNVPSHLIDRRAYMVGSGENTSALLQLLDKSPIERAVIYVERRSDVKNVVARLRASGRRVGGLSKDVSQDARERNFTRFIGGELDFLVATPAFGRGLNTNTNHVIVHGYPQTIDETQHISGRVGRGGVSGTAHYIVTPEFWDLFERYEQSLDRPIRRYDLPVGPMRPAVTALPTPLPARQERLRSNDRDAKVAAAIAEIAEFVGGSSGADVEGLVEQLAEVTPSVALAGAALHAALEKEDHGVVSSLAGSDSGTPLEALARHITSLVNREPDSDIEGIVIQLANMLDGKDLARAVVRLSQRLLDPAGQESTGGERVERAAVPVPQVAHVEFVPTLDQPGSEVSDPVPATRPIRLGIGSKHVASPQAVEDMLAKRFDLTDEEIGALRPRVGLGTTVVDFPNWVSSEEFGQRMHGMEFRGVVLTAVEVDTGISFF